MSNDSPVITQFSKLYSGFQLCKNLNLLLKQSKISVTELHRNTGVPINTIQRLKSDPECNPTIATLQPIADFFAVSVSQLIGDESLSTPGIPGIFVHKKDKWIKVQIITWEQATIWPDIEMSKKPLTISTDIDIGGNTFALEIMEDDWIGFQKNSIIIIDPNANPNERDFVVVHKSGVRTATLKKFLSYDGINYLVPLNDNFKTVIYNEEYRILGVVVQIRKDICR